MTRAHTFQPHHTHSQHHAWSKDEDELLIELVGKYGTKKWAYISSYLPNRVGKQCRERWRNHLNPAIRRGRFTHEEDELIKSLVLKHGTRWAKISAIMQGRTENDIKNRYYCSLRKEIEYCASPPSEPAKPAKRPSPAKPSAELSCSPSSVLSRAPLSPRRLHVAPADDAMTMLAAAHVLCALMAA